MLPSILTYLNLLIHFLFLPHVTEKYNFLGISIVGQSNERGDGGIYIGSIMKGGAVAADGRIEPGDMLLQVCASECAGAYLGSGPGKCVCLSSCMLCLLLPIHVVNKRIW